MHPTVLKIINTVSYAAMLLVNYLSISLPFNGRSAANVSELYANLFVPAGFVFPIVWSLIYLALGLWLVMQWIFKDSEDTMIEKVGLWFMVSCLLNIVWLFAWHWFYMEVATIVIISLMAALIKINLSIRSLELSRLQHFIVGLPFGIYQGWISIATIAMIAALFVHYGLSAVMDAELWTIIMSLAGTSIAIWMMFDHKNVLHGVVVAFALFGIWWKQNSRVDSVANTAMVLTVVLLILSVWATLRIMRGEPDEAEKVKKR
jgi:translocator protein